MKYKLKYSRDLLYQNCLYAMCAHIAAIHRMPNIACESSWDGMNYSFQSCHSTDGTISFDLQNGMVAGAFRKHTSTRLNEYPKKNALEYFMDADEKIQQLAQNEAL